MVQTISVRDANNNIVTIPITPISANTSNNSISVTVATDTSTIEPAASPITGATMPTGGTGLTGWLSAIWSKLNGILSSNIYVGGAAVSANNAVPVSVSTVPYIAPTSYTTGNTFSALGYGSVTFFCTVVATVAYTIQSSPDGTNWGPATGVLNTLTTASTFGLSAVTSISLSGGMYYRLSGGTGGTFLVGAGQ